MSNLQEKTTHSGDIKNLAAAGNYLAAAQELNLQKENSALRFWKIDDLLDLGKRGLLKMLGGSCFTWERELVGNLNFSDQTPAGRAHNRDTLEALVAACEKLPSAEHRREITTLFHVFMAQCDQKKYMYAINGGVRYALNFKEIYVAFTQHYKEQAAAARCH